MAEALWHGQRERCGSPQQWQVSLQEYEKLAALLDGAKLPLTERVKKFSPASSKIPMVEQAEEHARLLDELARNLSG